MHTVGAEIHEIEVPPLDGLAISAWLSDEGLTEVDVAAVGRATGGYPLHVDDLIRHLKGGGAMSDAPLNEQIMRRMEASWRELGVSGATTARVLCVLPDPLPQVRLLELTGLQPAEYGHVVQELQWARFFSVRVNGQPWFHEQRREFVLRQLDEDERDAGYSRAATVVWEEVLAREDFLYVDLFARLAENAMVLQEQDPKLAAVVKTRDDELAVLAALLELMVPQRDGATDGQELVRHARRFTTTTIDPSAVLGRLEKAGLIVWAKNEHAAVVLPSWTAYAAAAVHGRAARLLRRTPVPELAPLVYEVGLRPLLGSFEAMHFGVGRPSLASLSRLAARIDPDPDPHPFRIRSVRRDLGVNLLVRARYADRPLYAAVRYADEAARDEAAAAQGKVVEIFGEQFELVAALPHPLESVPTGRFVRSAERAFKTQRSHMLDSGDIRVALPVPIEYERATELRVETVRLLRERSSAIEREAMGIVEPYGLYWDERDGAWIECLVRGGPEQAVRVPGLATTREDRVFDFFALEQAIGLPEDVYIDHLELGGGARTANDPVFTEIGKRRTRAALFNSAQPRRRVVLEKDVLERLVRDGFLQQMADARALQSVAVQEVEPLPPTALYVLVVLEEPTPGWVAGAGSQVVALERLSDSGNDEAHVEIVQGRTDLEGGFGPAAVPPREDMFEELFGFPDGFANRDVTEFLTSIHGGMDSLVSYYAGFEHDDVDLRWPDEDF